MRYYEEIELSQYVPIAEAAQWLAFGFLPEADYSLSSGNRVVEIRENIDEILDKGGHALEYDLYFGESYLSRFFPSIDAKLYLSHYEKCGGQSPKQVEEHIESWREMRTRLQSMEGDIDLAANLSSRDKEFQEELSASKSLRELQRPIIHRLETSRAKIFLELASGRMKSKGLKMPPLHSPELESEEFEYPHEFSDILSDSWSLNCIDWNNSNLNSWDKSYKGVIVETADLLSIFPCPDITPLSVAGKIFGTTFIPEHDNGAQLAPESAPRRRGAPQRTETVLERAIHAHLSRHMEEGNLAMKKEAQVAEVTDFVRSKLGQELPRSTAQRILSRWMNFNAHK